MENPIVSQRKGLEIFRDVRAKLVERGLLPAAAEIYAKDIVARYGRYVLRGLPQRAHALVADEHINEIAELHWRGLKAARAA
jgi:hypothetical protein